MADMQGIDPSKDKRPLWGTQGGGLAEERHGKFYFVEAPGHSGLAYGDPLPDGWDIAPANEAARQIEEIGNLQGY